MTTRKKKPFWTKLLSALLIASMLMGTAGTSSLAAAGDPGENIEAEAAVSDDSAGIGDETTETPAADTGKTDVTPSDKVDPSAPKTDLPEGAGDNTLLNANDTQTGTSGEETGGGSFRYDGHI